MELRGTPVHVEIDELERTLVRVTCFMPVSMVCWELDAILVFRAAALTLVIYNAAEKWVPIID